MAETSPAGTGAPQLTAEQRELLELFEATFVGEGARRHSPKASTFLDGVKGFWERMTS